MLKVGLIGCGRIAQLFHLRALTSLAPVSVAALAESDGARLEQASRMCPHARTYPDYRQLLDDPGVDAVVICLPTGMHARSAIHAFAAGKHVYLEKPIAIDLNEAAEVVAAWRRSGRTGMMGFNFRFNAQYAAARERIASGTLGTLVAARSVFSSAARTLPAWKRSRATGGGVLLDLASHHFDLARFLFSAEITRVSVMPRQVRSPGDTALVETTLDSGLVMQSLFTMSSIEEHGFQVYGTRGRLTLDRVLTKAPHIMRPTMAYDPVHRIWSALAALDPRQLLRSPSEPSFEAALAAFAAAASANRSVTPDIEDGYRSLAAVVAAEESAARGTGVAVAA